MLNDKKKTKNTGRTFIGPAIFITTLIVSLIFFWWLLIYSHGITPQH